MMTTSPAGRCIYFLGICGTAMGNAALLARAAGCQVSGSDTQVYPPMSDVLRGAGIAISEGYDAARLETAAPDLVVIGNAMSRGNVEVEWLLNSRAIPFTSLPAFLHDQILSRRANLVVCGTHGKTTTTALAAHLLRENGFDPGYLIGGVPQDPPTGNNLGSAAAPFVIEGDEYDSAFFDKRSKFIHYSPRVAVLNNLEFDHADIFRDLADVQRTFSHLARIVPSAGWIILNGDDDNLRALGPMSWTRVVRVGTAPGNDVVIENFTENPQGAEFSLRWAGALWGTVRWQQPGIFNARNAAMAATAAQMIVLTPGPGVSASAPSVVPDWQILEPRISLVSLAQFRGVRRRQEIVRQTPAITVIEDFGHHPTALAETLQSLRARYPSAILTAIFEPRSNTARTKVLQAGFMRALALADEVYLGAVNRRDKVSAEERFDVDAVVQQLELVGVTAFAAETNGGLLDELIANSAPPGPPPKTRVVVFFTNGSFDGIIGKYAEQVV